MARQVETTYGDALLELALEEGSLNMLYEEAQALVTVLQENEELLRILKHPQIDKDEKRKIVDNISKDAYQRIWSDCSASWLRKIMAARL